MLTIGHYHNAGRTNYSLSLKNLMIFTGRVRGGQSTTHFLVYKNIKLAVVLAVVLALTVV